MILWCNITLYVYNTHNLNDEEFKNIFFKVSKILCKLFVCESELKLGNSDCWYGVINKLQRCNTFCSRHNI